MTAPPRKRHRIAHVAQRLTPGHVAPAREGDTDFAVVCAHNGALYATLDQCPHDGGPLSDGFVAGDLLVCARHQWEFALHDGICPYAQQRRITIWPLTRAGARATPTLEQGAAAHLPRAEAAAVPHAAAGPPVPTLGVSTSTDAPSKPRPSPQLPFPGIARPPAEPTPARSRPRRARKNRVAKSGK